MKNQKLLAQAILGAAVISLTFSCGTPPRPKLTPYNLQVLPRTQASIEVDLIGATELDKQDWEACSLDNYWKPGDPTRANADKLTLRIIGQTVERADGGKTDPIPLTDPVLENWFKRNDLYLVILANLPGKFEGGSADPRRKIVPLDQHWISKDKVLQIEIQDGRIRFLTERKP